VSEQEKEITQPFEVNGPTPAHSAEEGTQPIKVTPDAPQAQLPDWLLKFASGREQSVNEIQDADKPELLVSLSDGMEEEEQFIPPVMPGEAEWQELSDFEDQDPTDLEPVQEAQITTAEIEAFDEPVADRETNLIEEDDTALAGDPQLDMAESFKQEVRDLLKQGQREEAFALIRENKADPVLAEAAKKTLRSQLTLTSDAGDLWDIYDELNSSLG
jgi:hypothetical protein